MSLPSELWSIILLKITDKKSCKNLFKSLPPSIQSDIDEDYKKHYCIFKQLLCLSLNKHIILYNKQKYLKSIIHKDDVYNVAFRANTNQVIFSDSSGDIYLWDYLTNNIENLIRSPRGRLTPFIAPIIKIYFHLSPCGKFMIVNSFPSHDYSIFKFDIDERKKTIIPFFFESVNTNFTIIFNPVIEEFVLLSYFFREVGRFQLKMNIVNSKNLTSKYFINDDYYAPFYDEFGNLYAIMKNKGIFLFLNEKFELVMESKEYISYFIVKNGIIYYIENPHFTTFACIKSFDVERNVTHKMEIKLSPYEFIKNLQISKNGKQLVFSDDNKITFLDIESNNIVRNVFNSQVLQDEKMNERIMFTDFCMKNF